MKEPYPLTAATACLLISSLMAIGAQGVVAAAQKRQPRPTPPATLRPEERGAAETALRRLQSLRDGWNDVNRQFIQPNVKAGRKLDWREYEVQYLEARTAADEARRVLPRGELRAAVEQAMGLFEDLEEIEEIFANRSPITTSVRVSDVYPYLKKYSVPYEGVVVRAGYGLTLHKDFVMSYILPLRFARVNRVEVFLGGSPHPTPPPPTFEQMFRLKARKPDPAPPPSAPPPAADEEVLKDVAMQALKAKLLGSRERMAALLDDGFVCYMPDGKRLDKRQYLEEMERDRTVKRFDLERVVLRTKDGASALSATVKYESFAGESRSFFNAFTFVYRDGRWLISSWRAY